MGIKSAENWSGTVIAGVLLGEPVVRDDGTFEWDGGVPCGFVDDHGMFTPDDDDAEPVALASLPDVTVRRWEKPDSEHDAPGARAVVADAKERTWVSLVDANLATPGKSGWRALEQT
jgi:hypothetical protein